MFQGVRSLCSVAVAFARLAHALSRVLMSLCSPTSPAATTSVISAPWQLPAAARTSKKVNPAALTVDDKPAGGGGGKDHLLLVSPQPAPPALFKGECNAAEERTTAKAARGRRPSRLVIPPPVACAAGVDPFGEVAGRETDVAPEVEVHGEGFCLASRRGVRHAMEDGYGVITTADNVGGDSQMAFYGVYDGHGGRAAVDFVADKLGKNVVAALAASTAAEMSQRRSDRPPSSSSSSRGSEKEDEEHEVNAVMAAIRSAYLTTDSEFLSQGVRGGACAATALVKDGELYVAHVGDCRAVLGSRGGVATALTTDHTAGREDERRRIESSGGYVSCGNGGVWRVQDCLAVSRAFGDASMKPWVTCEPEISRRRLTPDCRFLVVASDGLWNKVSCQEAVDVVGAAATSSLGSCKDLVAMARTRGSRDDITVMVVDLQRFLR